MIRSIGFVEYCRRVETNACKGIAVWSFPSDTAALASELSTGDSQLCEVVEVGFQGALPIFFTWTQTADDLHLDIQVELNANSYEMDRLSVRPEIPWPNFMGGFTESIEAYTCDEVLNDRLVAIRQSFRQQSGRAGSVWISAGVCWGGLGELVRLSVSPPCEVSRLRMMSRYSMAR